MARIAIIVADDFEDAELDVPRSTLEKHGHQVDLIGIEPGEAVTGKRGSTCVPALGIDDADPDAYDALVIPGGYSPDHLRTDDDVVAFVRTMVQIGKPVAAVCHAPWLLIEADVVEGRTVTSWPSLVTDLRNAGANWVDEPVVVDGLLITSRRPDDLPAFTDAILQAIAPGARGRGAA
jgi:protease I